MANGVHNDSDEPPAASMFSRSTKRQKQLDGSDAMVNGMMNVVTTLCQAVTDKQSKYLPLHLVSRL